MEALERVPLVGNAVIDKLKRTKDSIKQLFIPGMLFENMGITYLGPVDGHNIPALCKVLKEAKKLDHAVLIHVITKRERDINLRRRILPYFTVWVLLILQREKKMGKEGNLLYRGIFQKAVPAWGNLSKAGSRDSGYA